MYLHDGDASFSKNTFSLPRKKIWKQYRLISEMPTQKKLFEQNLKEGGFRGFEEKKNPKTEGTKAGLFKDHWGSQCVREETSKTARPKSGEMGEVVKVG